MAFDRKRVDKKLRATGDVLHFLLPYYTKSTMKIMDRFSSVIFQGKRPISLKVAYSQINIQREDETNLRMCVYSSASKKQKSSVAVLWFHGGGYAMSEPEQDYNFFKNFIKKHNAVVFAPDYTKSIEKPFPAAFNDARLALEYVKSNAESYGVSSDNIFVGGDSAGGGLALSLALYARDVGDKSIAYVMSIYPMLNHRVTQTSKDNKMPIWNTKSNQEAWALYIGDFDINDSKFKYASPAVEKTFSNLPPVLTYIGTEDPFYAETVELISNLKSAGVQVDFKIFEGCYHGFDVVCPLAPKSKEAKKFLLDGFEKALNKLKTKE